MSAKREKCLREYVLQREKTLIKNHMSRGVDTSLTAISFVMKTVAKKDIGY